MTDTSVAYYSAAFTAAAFTVAVDAFEIVAPAAKRVRIREIRLHQTTEFGDAAAEILAVTMHRGFTTAGSGGTAVTPGNLKSGGPAASSAVKYLNTTLATAGSPQLLKADGWNVAAGFWYYPPDREMIELAASERLVVRVSAPADSITAHGTLVFEEFGFKS